MIEFFKKNNIWLWVISLLIAVLLWAYVTTVQDPSRDRTVSGIPLVFSGEDTLEENGFRITKGHDATLGVKFIGRLSDLNKLNKDNITLLVDVGRFSVAGDYSASYSVQIPDDLSGRVQVVVGQNLTVPITIDQLVKKTVPVRLKQDYEVAEDYMALDKEVILQPPSLNIKGPSGILDTIEYAEVSIGAGTVLDKTVENQAVGYSLKTSSGKDVPESGLNIDAEKVYVTVPVVKTKDVPLTVGFINGGGLEEGVNVVWSVEPSVIALSGDAGTLDALNSILLYTIDLAMLEKADKYEYPIIVPEGVTNISGHEEAVVTIEFKGVSTARISTSRIDIINAQPPEGYRVESVNVQLPVDVRGKSESVALVKPENLRITVDLEDVTLRVGKQSVTADVAVEGISGVGVVGSYVIIINVVREPEPDEP